MKTRYQLVVIGAGPAGGYAAWTAAKGGLDVLLVEREVKVGSRLACAEAVSLDGMKNFVEPDPCFISGEVDTISFTIATGYNLVHKFPKCVGFVLDRPGFDRYLAERAVEGGADLSTGTYAGGIELSDGGPVTVQLETASETTMVKAEYVIAADGVESMIGRMAGIDTLLELHQCDTSLQYRVEGVNLDSRRLEFYVGEKYSPDGYLWVFPKSDHSANIGLGVNPADNDSRILRQKLDRFLKDRYGEYKIEFETCGMVPKFIGLDILGRGRLLLAGDAARTIDSLTGAGINRAMHTGQLAARAVLNSAAGGISPTELVQYYRDSVNEELGRDLRFYKMVQKVFRKFTDQDWENMARFLEKYLSKQKAESLDPAMILKAALTSAPRLMRLARHLF
jgi:digeranylgeranylglycerophospholipid reductase